MESDEELERHEHREKARRLLELWRNRPLTARDLEEVVEDLELRLIQGPQKYTKLKETREHLDARRLVSDRFFQTNKVLWKLARICLKQKGYGQ